MDELQELVSDRLESPAFWVATAFWVWISYVTGEIRDPNSLYAVYVIFVDVMAGAVLSFCLESVFQSAVRARKENEQNGNAQFPSFAFRLGTWLRRMLKRS